MRWLLIAAVAVAVAATVLVLSGDERGRPPRLRVADDAPFIVDGRGFVGHETVSVVVRNEGGSYRREVRAGDHGTFRVTLVEVRLGRCGRCGSWRPGSEAAGPRPSCLGPSVPPRRERGRLEGGPAHRGIGSSHPVASPGQGVTSNSSIPRVAL